MLTRFTVGQALEELLDQDGRTTTAAEILDLTVCEPALGSGAFAIEAVRQLAEQYLTRRQDELGERIDPDEYPRRLQEVKAYLALHNVYGVDLNATAVELAEISLWLDTMVAGPVGAVVRAAPAARQLAHRRPARGLPPAPGRRQVLAHGRPPRRAARPRWSTTSTPSRSAATSRGGIHHFLLPADGWGAAADAKEADALAPDAADGPQGAGASRSRPSPPRPRSTTSPSSPTGSRRCGRSPTSGCRSPSRRSAGPSPSGKPATCRSAATIQREQIEARSPTPNGAYRRLRRVMDAWAALWFWPLTDTVTTVDVDGQPIRVEPPTLDQWIAGLQALLGRSPEARKRAGADAPTLSAATGWDELGEAEDARARLRRCRRRSSACSPRSSMAGGVRARRRAAGLLPLGARLRPGVRPRRLRPAGRKPAVGPAALRRRRAARRGRPVVAARRQADPGAHRRASARRRSRFPASTDLVLDGTTDVACLAAFVGAVTRSTRTWRDCSPTCTAASWSRLWQHTSARGTVGLIHPETHFTDEKAGLLRAATYRRLRRHWQFVNELVLFEIQTTSHLRRPRLRPPRREPSLPAWPTSLYHPDTVGRSLDHDGSGPEPGLKDPDGNWDLRPHASRIHARRPTTMLDDLARGPRIRRRARPADPDGLRGQPIRRRRCSTSCPAPRGSAKSRKKKKKEKENLTGKRDDTL